MYSLGAALNIVGKDRNDMLHELIYSVTGKESIAALNANEYITAEKELVSRLRSAPTRKRQKNEEQVGNYGMATVDQQRLCWRYCYRLKDLDPNPRSANAADRLVGAIAKILGVTASKKDPFRWVTQEQCSKLIEQLKRYVNTAQRQQRQGEKCAGS